MKNALLLAVLAGAMVVTEADDAPLILDVRPTMTSSPGAFRVRATVDRDDDNRRLEIAADSLRYYRSTIQLDGAYLPAGHYRIQARLERADGRSRGAPQDEVAMPRVSGHRRCVATREHTDADASESWRAS